MVARGEWVMNEATRKVQIKGKLYVIVPFWYALAAYQASLVEPGSYFGETE